MWNKHKKLWITLISILLGLLLIVGVAGGAFLYITHKLYDRMDYSPNTDFSIPSSDNTVIGPSFDFSQMFPSMLESNTGKTSSESLVQPSESTDLTPSGSRSPLPSTEPPVPSSDPVPSDSPTEPSYSVPDSLTEEQLRLIYQQLLEQRTEKPAVQPAEQKDLEAAIKDQYEKNKENPISDKNVYNLLVIGYDQTPGSSHKNSDTMIIVSINYSKKTLTLTSLMRDSYVYIPAVGYNRLNVAYAVGGYGLLKTTIERNFGITVDNYVAVKFEAFVRFYDMVGGVKVNVPNDKGFLDYFNKNILGYYKMYGKYAGMPDSSEWHTSPISGGEQMLDGVQLLLYARCRTSSVGDADFGRTERQRQLLTLTIGKLRDSSDTRLYSLLNNILPYVTTDLTYSDCCKLAWKVNDKGVLNYQTQSLRIPADGTFEIKVVRIGGTNQDVLSVNFEANKKRFFTLVYGSYTG